MRGVRSSLRRQSLKSVAQKVTLVVFNEELATSLEGRVTLKTTNMLLHRFDSIKS